MDKHVFIMCGIEFKFYSHNPKWFYIDNELVSEYDEYSLKETEYLDTLFPLHIKELLGADNYKELCDNITTYYAYVYNSTHEVFWEYVYNKYDISFIGILRKEFDIMIAEVPLEHTYDYRIAIFGDVDEMVVYDKIRNNSFLGKIDKLVTIDNNLYHIGLNFGS